MEQVGISYWLPWCRYSGLDILTLQMIMKGDRGQGVARGSVLHCHIGQVDRLTKAEWAEWLPGKLNSFDTCVTRGRAL